MEYTSDAASLVTWDYFNNIEMFICRCEKTFDSITQWENHNFHYHMNLKYTCNHCNYRYLDINDFVNHMRSEHSTNYSYCFICRNLYYRETDFQNHIYWYHVSYDQKYLLSYTCYKCTPWREIESENDFFTHDAREHCYNLTEFICYVCGKKFANYRARNIHKESHYRKKSHVCLEPSCGGRTFLTLNILREHIKKNHPNRFLCKRCFSGIIFMSEADLKRHVEAFHRNQFELS